MIIRCCVCDRELDIEDYIITHMCPHCSNVIVLKEDSGDE